MALHVPVKPTGLGVEQPEPLQSDLGIGLSLRYRSRLRTYEARLSQAEQIGEPVNVRCHAAQYQDAAKLADRPAGSFNDRNTPGVDEAEIVEHELDREIPLGADDLIQCGAQRERCKDVEFAKEGHYDPGPVPPHVYTEGQVAMAQREALGHLIQRLLIWRAVQCNLQRSPRREVTRM